VKAEHQRPAGWLKPLKILEWKWANIMMDFLVELSRSPRGNDAICVVIDRLTKVVHFIPIKTTNSGIVLVLLFIKGIRRLHGVPKSIVSDQDFKFVSNFWQRLHSALHTNTQHQYFFLPSDGQSECTIHTLGICMPVCFHGREVEKITYLWRSLLTTTVTKLVFIWHHTKCRA
jgi:hypothetical protein